MRFHDLPKVPPNQFGGPRCNCLDPIMIAIPNGGHIHVQCPFHGDRIIRGSNVRWNVR